MKLRGCIKIINVLQNIMLPFIYFFVRKEESDDNDDEDGEEDEVEQLGFAEL